MNKGGERIVIKSEKIDKVVDYIMNILDNFEKSDDESVSEMWSSNQISYEYLIELDELMNE